MKTIAALAVVLCCAVARADDAPARFTVKITGAGRPMILIPGLSCSGEVWDETVAHFKGKYECHVLTLAGFAGVKPVDGPFLEPTAKAIVDYVKAKKLNKPVVVGHSLGGHLVFKLGIMEPDLFGPLIAVDGLPCLGALRKEDITKDEMKQQGDMIRGMFGDSTPEQNRMRHKAMIETWVIDSKRVEQIAAWGAKSDTKIVANAVGELFANDLRDEAGKIKSPVLLTAAFHKDMEDYGMTRDLITERYANQIKKIPNKKLAVADNAKHFLMYDAQDWLFKQMDEFLAAQK